MSRIRTIKPEFPQSSTLGSVSRDARLCAVNVLTMADDEGRLTGNLRVLAGQLYPFDDDARDLLDGWLAALECVGFIQRYTADGKPYISITGWKKHQKIDRPGQSRLPPPPERSAGMEALAHVQASPDRRDDISTQTREDSMNTREDSMGTRETSLKSSDSTPRVQRGLDAGSRTLDQGSGTEDQEEKPSRKRAAAAARHLSVDDLVVEGVDKSVAADWLAVRKAKDAPLTETALKAVKREAAKAGMDLGDAVRIAAEKGWRSFEARWLHGGESNVGHPAAAQTEVEKSAAKAARIAASMGGTQPAVAAVTAPPLAAEESA